MGASSSCVEIISLDGETYGVWDFKRYDPAMASAARPDAIVVYTRHEYQEHLTAIREHKAPALLFRNPNTDAQTFTDGELLSLAAYVQSGKLDPPFRGSIVAYENMRDLSPKEKAAALAVNWDLRRTEAYTLDVVPDLMAMHR